MILLPNPPSAHVGALEAPFQLGPKTASGEPALVRPSVLEWNFRVPAPKV
jgi:hypothetical protein